MCERVLELRWTGLSAALTGAVKKLGCSIEGLPDGLASLNLQSEADDPSSDNITLFSNLTLPPDVTLSASGKQVRAHRFVLAACSPFFATIFQENPVENPIIILQDVNFKALCVIISFMYNGEVNVMEKFLPVIINTAESLQVKGLSFAKSDSELNSECAESKSKPKDNEKHNRVSFEEICCNNKIEEIKVVNSDGEYPEEIKIIKENCKRKYELELDCVVSLSKTKSTSTDTEKSCEVSFNEAKKSKIEIIDNYEVAEKSEDKHTSTISSIEDLSPDIINQIESYSDIGHGYNYYLQKPSFPCPFCHRTYQSWGYRRRHIKKQHHKNSLPCKWCKPCRFFDSDVLWNDHVLNNHELSTEEAKESLIILVEAHAVINMATSSRDFME